ncbi:DUF7344 domain-containing protein [Haloterrigena gelatinilytica]
MVSWACPTNPREASGLDPEAVHMSLYHSHVPRLDEWNLVSYDQERDAIALTDRGEKFALVQTQLSSSEFV